ncbi:MAG: carbohydrate kinase family protein [bacterium]
MKNQFDVLTIGGAVQDITFYTSDGKILKNPDNDQTCLELLGFEYGAKVKVEEANFTFGGGAQNAAVSIARLGYKAAALISVGNDGVGKEIIDNLKSNKVNTKFVQTKDTSTGFSFVLTDRKTSEHVVFSYRGANDKLVLGNELKIALPKWIYMTSLSGNWEKNVIAKVFKFKKSSNCRIAWNPGTRQLEAGYCRIGKYLQETDVLILNKDEAVELVISAEAAAGRVRDAIYRVGGTKKLARELYGMVYGKNANGIAVVTDGRRGAYAYDGKKIYYSPVIKVKRVDTTGVGDAFGSSFIAGLEMYKGNIQKALDLGNLNTSSVIGKVGAENGLLYKSNITLKSKV